MDILNFATAVGAIIAGPAAVAAAIYGRGSKNAAVRSADAAEKAVNLASESNQIAKNANVLATRSIKEAEKGNQIAQASQEQQRMQTEAILDQRNNVWKAKLQEPGEVIVIDKSPSVSRNISIVIYRQNRAIARATVEEAPGFTEIAVDVSEVFNEYKQAIVDGPITTIGAQLFVPGVPAEPANHPVPFTIEILITWETTSGKLLSENIEQTITYIKKKDGIREYRPRSKAGKE